MVRVILIVLLGFVIISCFPSPYYRLADGRKVIKSKYKNIKYFDAKIIFLFDFFNYKITYFHIFILFFSYFFIPLHVCICTCDLYYIVLFYIQIYKRLFVSTNIKYKI